MIHSVFQMVDAYVGGTFFPSSDWNDFIVRTHKEIAIDICCRLKSNISYNLNYFKPYSKGLVMYNNDGGLMSSNYSWTKAYIYALNFEQASSLIMVELYSYLVTRRTLLMHSSLIDYQGNGIMFLGPSGIGKTTQAELWNQFTGANILNGDMVFVRENPDGFYGYGSPWHGSSPYCMNAKVKLKALVVLEQASENSIRKLSGFDVLQGIMDQVFLPHWYPEGMTPCLDTLNDLLAQIPVYHLACRPDEDAVQLLKNELQI